MKTQFTIEIPSIEVSKKIDAGFAKDLWGKHSLSAGSNRSVLPLKLHASFSDDGSTVIIDIGGRFVYIDDKNEKESYKKALEIIGNTTYKFSYDFSIKTEQQVYVTDVFLNLEFVE